jgi:glycosyltransferase involved in cell wall biosynthesis
MATFSRFSVSVLINSYNYRQFVGEAIASALAQTHAPLEVIVVDDGSTDGTANDVESDWVARDSRVRLIRQANRGQLAAMQTAVAAARGELLFFLDADDTWEPGYVAAACAVFVRDPQVDYLFSGHTRSDGGPSKVLGERRDRRLGRRCAQAYATGRYPISMTSTLSMWAPLARRFLPVPEGLLAEWKINADQVLALGAALAGGTGAFLAGDWVRYRIHGANHFAGRADVVSPAARAARRACADRARRILAEKLSLGPETADRIGEDFSTIERPKWRECRRALKAAKLSPRGWSRRLALMSGILARFALRSGGLPELPRRADAPNPAAQGSAAFSAR